MKINYSELSYLMGCPVSESKAIFAEELGVDKPKRNEEIDTGVLRLHFGKQSSHDDRFHGLFKLDINISQLKDRFRKHISDPKAVKSLKLPGGKSIYYKALSQEDIDFLNQRLYDLHCYKYSVKSANEAIEKAKVSPCKTIHPK